jgi:hypothetical protein
VGIQAGWHGLPELIARLLLRHRVRPWYDLQSRSILFRTPTRRRACVAGADQPVNATNGTGADIATARRVMVSRCQRRQLILMETVASH